MSRSSGRAYSGSRTGGIGNRKGTADSSSKTGTADSRTGKVDSRTGKAGTKTDKADSKRGNVIRQVLTPASDALGTRVAGQAIETACGKTSTTTAMILCSGFVITLTYDDEPKKKYVACGLSVQNLSSRSLVVCARLHLLLGSSGCIMFAKSMAVSSGTETHSLASWR